MKKLQLLLVALAIVGFTFACGNVKEKAAESVDAVEEVTEEAVEAVEEVADTLEAVVEEVADEGVEEDQE